MQSVYGVLVSATIIDGFVGAYYLLQVYFNLKPGRGMSILTDSWFFHPEYLHEEGRGYRKKYFYSLAIFVLLVVVLNFLIRVGY